MAHTAAIGALRTLSQDILNGMNRIQKAYSNFLLLIDQVAEWLDARERFLVSLLVVTYSILVLPIAYARPLWHDELFTYNIALSSSISQMMENIRRADLNPPLLYCLNCMTLRLPGAQANEFFTNLAARLPSILSGLVASLALFALLRKRISPLYSMAAVLLLWNTIFFLFASEDRPYALVCALLMLMMLAWQRANQSKQNLRWTLVLLVLGCAMMASHFVGSFLLLAFLAAEAAQCYQRRRVNWLRGLVLLVPFAIPVIYRSMVSASVAPLFPAEYQPTAQTFAKVYLALLHSSVLVVIVAMLLCLITAGSQHQGPSKRESSFTFSERVLLLVLLLEPILFVASQMLRHGYFHVRYGLPGCIPLSILMVLLFHSLFHARRRVALILIGVSVLVLSCSQISAWTTYSRANSASQKSASSPLSDYRQVDSNLPFVVASALTYVEMNHYESPGLLSRTYYLTDTPSAIEYAHATLFESEAMINGVFHFQSHVEPLHPFESGHQKFLVLGTMDYPEDWLLRKLQAEGDSLRYLGKFATTYKDADLYEVTLRRRQ